MLFFLLGSFGFEGGADFVDEVNEGVDVAVALAHGGGFAIFEESDELEDLDFEVFFGPGESGLALVAVGDAVVDEGFVLGERHGVVEGFDLVAEHGGDDGGQAGDIAVVVGAEDRDELVAVCRAIEFVFVVGDVTGDIGEAAVFALEDAVLVVAEFGGAEPDCFGCGLADLTPLIPLSIKTERGRFNPSLGEGNTGFTSATRVVFVVGGLDFFEDFFDDAAFGHDDFGSDGLVVGDAGGDEVLEFLFDDAGVVEGLFGEPQIEKDAKSLKCFILVCNHLLLT